MAETVYVAATEPGSGKTVVTLGLVMHLSRMVDRLGYMKPIGTKISDQGETVDDDVLIMRDILNDETDLKYVCPVTFDDVRESILSGGKEDVLRRIVSAYRKLAESIKGLQIKSDTHVKDFVTESDVIEADLNAFIRGVRLGEPTWYEDLSCEVPAEVTVAKVWCERRLTCLKRSTLGAHALGVLDDPWLSYTQFHLDVVGCLLCLANLQDLESEDLGEGRAPSESIFASSVGFLSRVSGSG